VYRDPLMREDESVDAAARAPRHEPASAGGGPGPMAFLHTSFWIDPR
jgi:hypothetical protein